MFHVEHFRRRAFGLFSLFMCTLLRFLGRFVPFAGPRARAEASAQEGSKNAQGCLYNVKASSLGGQVISPRPFTHHSGTVNELPEGVIGIPCGAEPRVRGLCLREGICRPGKLAARAFSGRPRELGAGAWGLRTGRLVGL